MLNRPHPVFLILNLPIVALSVTVLIFATHSADAFAQPQHGGVDKEGSWYVGENLRVGDYFSYDMCHINYKNCAEFNLQIWFKEEVLTRDGPRWITKVAVIDGDRTIVGNMTLGDRFFDLISISPELREYGKAFESSVPWMSYFVSDGWDSDGNRGEKFTDVWAWSPTNISWTWLMPIDTEDITVPAGSWEDAVIISYHRGPGYTDNIWIADEFPFPIKADMDAYVVGDRTRELAFTLVDYGNTPESPFIGIISTSEQERAACEARSGGIVPVRDTTDGSKYEIRASYGPEHPEEGCWIGLSVEFLGRDGMLLERVQFDVVVLDDDGGAARSIADELGSRFLYAQSGTYHLEFGVREPPGIAEYTIVVHGSAPDWVVPDQSERDVLTIPVEVRPNAGTEMPGSDGNALANEAGHTRAPLAQARDGVQVDDVACSENHMLMMSPSGSPACVFADSVIALEQRGFAVIGGADSGEPGIATMELSDRMITIVSSNSDPTNISGHGVYAYWPKYSITFPENVMVGEKFEVVFDYRYITPNAEGSYENFEERCEYSSCEEDSFDIGVPTYVDFSHELAEVLGLNSTDARYVPHRSYNVYEVDPPYDNTQPLQERFKFVINEPDIPYRHGEIYATMHAQPGDKIYFYVGNDGIVRLDNKFIELTGETLRNSVKLQKPPLGSVTLEDEQQNRFDISPDTLYLDASGARETNLVQRALDWIAINGGTTADYLYNKTAWTQDSIENFLRTYPEFMVPKFLLGLSDWLLPQAHAQEATHTIFGQLANRDPDGGSSFVGTSFWVI